MLGGEKAAPSLAPRSLRQSLCMDAGEAVKRTAALQGSRARKVVPRSDAPGPGQYNQQISVRLSKYQAGGTTSFGFGERTRMATVAF